MQVSGPLEQLFPVLFDLADLEFDLGVLEQAREIVVHVRKNHESSTDFELGRIPLFDNGDRG